MYEKRLGSEQTKLGLQKRNSCVMRIIGSDFSLCTLSWTSQKTFVFGDFKTFKKVWGSRTETLVNVVTNSFMSIPGCIGWFVTSTLFR